MQTKTTIIYDSPIIFYDDILSAISVGMFPFFSYRRDWRRFCKTKRAKPMGRKRNWCWLKKKKRDGAEGVSIFGHGCQTPSSWLFLSSLMIYLYTVITNASWATEFFFIFFFFATHRPRQIEMKEHDFFKPVSSFIIFLPLSRSFEITAAWDGDCGGDESRWQSSPSVVASISIISRWDMCQRADGFHTHMHPWRSSDSFETRMKLVSPRWFAHAGSR